MVKGAVMVGWSNWTVGSYWEVYEAMGCPS